MMKIKSRIDVITNSSTEVFVLRDFRSEPEIKEILSKLGYQGEVFKFTENLWKEHLKSEEKNYRFEELSTVFCDSSSKDRGWVRLYIEYLTSPRKTDPQIFRDREYFEDENTIKDIHLKLIKEILVPLAENEYNRIRKDTSLDTSYREKCLKRFIDNPTEDYVYNCPGYLLWKEEEKVVDFVEKNKDHFPEYSKLLRMYDMHDISELFGTWVDFFDDDSISPDKFLGEIYENEKIDYELYRLS